MRGGYGSDESGSADKSDTTKSDSDTDSVCAGRGDRDDSAGERMERRHEQQRRDNACGDAAEFFRRDGSGWAGEQQRHDFLACSICERRVGLGRAGCVDGDGRRTKSTDDNDANSYTDADANSYT
jgi:hypothetical protein